MEIFIIDFFLTYCKYLTVSDSEEVLDTPCPICQETILDTNRSFIQVDLPNCKHIICSQCLQLHIAHGNVECPLCRTTWFEHLPDPFVSNPAPTININDYWHTNRSNSSAASTDSDIGYLPMPSDVDSSYVVEQRAGRTSISSISSTNNVDDYSPDGFLRDGMAGSHASERIDFLTDIHRHFHLWIREPRTNPLTHWRAWRAQLGMTNIPWDPVNEAKQMRRDIGEAMGLDSDAEMLERVTDPFVFWRSLKALRRLRGRAESSLSNSDSE
ncbi:hypothetical protein BDV96DRAFT_651159 [Lophiotrema nucula]|uniref:RING-type domain-containing protein n=1 Tax=Lophiotrema nucula TaxID=690887 RepID=A0A6A5YWP2_9PLEO|nr:hypothetical protein BDV96DRAFT_651159 [Lophiotrema nucula]